MSMADLVRDFLAAAPAQFSQQVTRPQAVGYGTDLVCFDDIDPTMAETDPNGVDSLAQDCYHRISTTRGSVPDAPDFGVNVVEFLHRPTTARELAAMGGQCETEIRKDDRVDQVRVTVTGSADGKRLDISVVITPVDPDLVAFTLIVVVTDGAALLAEIRKAS